jgi:predicted HicB family RNase H-like nuclease
MLNYKGYVGIAEFDKEAKIFHGEVINRRDIITFQGDTIRKLTKAFKDSIDDYLYFCRGAGKEPKRELL